MAGAWACYRCSLWASCSRYNALKTNATRQLDQLGISYELRDYEVELDDLGAIKVASQIGLPVSQVFKTLCAKANDGTIVFAVVLGDRELDLKALAGKKNYPVYIHDSALSYPILAVSAGVRGTQIVLAPQDYIRSTQATSGGIARKPVK